MFFTVSSRFEVGWDVSSAELMTSIGDADVVTVRSVRWVPVITISSIVPAGFVEGTAAPCAAQAASAWKEMNAVAAEASSHALDARKQDIAMSPPGVRPSQHLGCDPAE